ncbi:hypothetical protein B0T14DRAFT_246304 [Immersiella caudata]|uniref:Uncharacterized protein n=1 Tax=Immersiella caudata TaxID=314043 RepID=A0AA39WJ69_9PEZI|nr:hypothetical protein B0T14DRAFT_246304 [Immersiella caudata]
MRCRPCQRFLGSHVLSSSWAGPAPTSPAQTVSLSLLTRSCHPAAATAAPGRPLGTPLHPRHPCSDGLPNVPKRLGETRVTRRSWLWDCVVQRSRSPSTPVPPLPRPLLGAPGEMRGARSA